MKLFNLSGPALKSVFQGNVLMLGLVSFFTDFSSEMIYPLLPLFFSGLVSSGMVAVYIGLMDGIAETVASVLKIYSGRISDAVGRRKPLVFLGYGISTFARPALAVCTAGWHVILLRFVDRIGKGIRTAPRDALISESVYPEVRGLAFSFHRSMDHAGAVLGPVTAGIFLYLLLGGNELWSRFSATADQGEMHALRWLFAFALIPGIAAVWIITSKIKESRGQSAAEADKPENHNAAPLPGRFYVFLAAVTLFALGNSSDLFLLYYAQTQFNLGPGYLILFWTVLHLSKICFSMPGGWLSDRLGRQFTITCGWIIYMAVYCAFPFAAELWMIWLLIIAYGFFYGMTEGSEKALVADFVPADCRGRAYGLYHGFVGLGALPASLVFGVLWSVAGPKTSFMLGAFFAAAAAAVITALFLATAKKPSATR
ncbi:MAG: MFS transporter [Victivallaceae bacterium]|jgi:MFS family permease